MQMAQVLGGYIVRFLLYLVLILGVSFGALAFLSRHDEVVTLTTNGPEGPVETPLWVVDGEDRQWLRGNKDSGWVTRLREDPKVSLERGGQSAPYEAVLAPDDLDTVNQLMREKYEWRDTMVMAFPSNSAAIRLDPIE